MDIFLAARESNLNGHPTEITNFEKKNRYGLSIFPFMWVSNLKFVED